MTSTPSAATPFGLSPPTPFFTALAGRGWVRVQGPRRRAFLQRLLTQDVGLLDSRPSLYACLLTPQGKFLHDMLMTESGEEIVLECEGGDRAEDLARRLRHYALRAEADIACVPERTVYAGIGPEPPRGATPDPRHPALGWRSESPPAGIPEKPFAAWDRLRLSLGVPDGSRDLIPERSTLEEGRIDRLEGVSYSKGCYVGQELTARMHHRGLGKKHLHPVRLTHGPVATGTILSLNGSEIGEMRSSCGDLGLALLRDDAIEALRASPDAPAIPLVPGDPL